MMRDNDSNSHVDPVITEMDVTQQIPILHVCDLGERISKTILAKKNWSQVCSTDKRESESIIVAESSREEIEPESPHKSINTNKEKYEIYDTEHEEPLVTDNKVINEPR